MFLPDKIRAYVGSKPYTTDAIGKSGSCVLCYEDMVLKIEPQVPRFWKDTQMLRWLAGRLPVPSVLEAVQEKGNQYLLMSRVPGVMACDPTLLANPKNLIHLLADALQQLWQVDIQDCPRHRRLEEDLLEARERVDRGLIELEDTEPGTFGPDGFKDPEALLAWLEANQPPLEPVLSHGDFCLPNVFFCDNTLSGFIDLNDCGVSDKWRDIALCYRSLQHNFSGKYAARAIDTDPDLLFRELGIEPNWEKLRYYILLDELF